ncbi:hypothetical protein SYNPS1DRAFT_30007 [Syncephalis pseudoplumigaleata]|uniref:UDP-glycosyltransferases domain-containing protein n=1 Tax=Syncephalis pseudoplumigaleata TaxID=1712513 RepID=A0A4P9YW38_9FUNG|nr:hypothetical protein SYNPS1DRAFT_30007 [Syncephalis pseudoplumigaleata]|eukprot:RKP24227.1 hypothetical protein SYNPS1DRAFT_30007 [Syncephalis pseudoplumigaleata]
MPMFAVCRELIARGHQATFVLNDPKGELAPDMPGIKRIAYGDGFNERHDSRKRIEELFVNFDYIDLDALAGNFYKVVYADYTEKLAMYTRLMSDAEGVATVDVALCDFIDPACVDAARRLHIPYAVFTLSVDYDAPTSMTRAGYIRTSYLPYRAGTLRASMEHAPFYERVYNTIYAPIRTRIKTWSGLGEQAAALAQAGVPHYSSLTANHKHGLVIVYTFSGFELPRLLPPNVFYAGPLLEDKYPGLSAELTQFLEPRSRVLYVGFGGLTPLSSAYFELLVRALLAAHRAQLIDGVVWGLMLTDASRMPSVIEEDQLSLPLGAANSSSSSSNTTTHLLSDMLDGKHPFIRILKRAPQRALLEHPSVRAFISHCGLTSLHETMLAGKPAVCIPGFGDQPMNAYRLEYLGAGERIFWWEASVKVILEKLARLLEGEAAESARLAMARLGEMARLASGRTPMAADMVEMAAIPGVLPLLQPAEHRMPWWRVALR